MRATTAFNYMLQLEGAWVRSVTFEPDGIVIGLKRRFKRLTCPECEYSTRARYDASTRRWRHLDVGGSKLFLECEIRRLKCRRCDRVVTEQVPWARPGARLTRDLQDLAAFMAQRMDKSTVCALLRTSFETVADLVQDVVAEHINEERLNNVFQIGVDEISYRKGHRYLTIVANHDINSSVIWAGEGKNSDTLNGFYELLGPERCKQIEAVSLDMGGAFAKSTTKHAPQARQCIDPFHVIKLANDAIDKVRRKAWQASGQDQKIKHTRWALLKDPTNLTDKQRATLVALKADRNELYRCWQLKEALRDIYKRVRPDAALAYLKWWLAWAARSRIPAFVTLGRTIRKHRDGIIAAIELGLSNSRLEGTNSKIRLINHRGYGHHTAQALIAMIYLCCGGITIQLPLN